MPFNVRLHRSQEAEDFIGLDDAGIERFRNMAILFGGTNVQNLTPETIDSAIRNIQALHRVAPDQVAVAPGNLSIGATRKKHVADVDELSRADLIAEVRSGAQEFGVKIGPQTVAKLKERAALMRLVRDLPEAHPHKPTHNGIAKARRELGLNTEPYQATTIDRTGIPSITAALRPPAATNSKIRALVDKPISVNLGDDVNHMQPSTLDQFEDAGYDVTPVVDEQGNIVHVALEKDGRKVNIVSLGDMNPDSIRDRTYKVYIGGTISGNTVKGGQEIKSLGGNKKFTVPGDLVAINSPDDITAAVAVLNAGKLPTDDTYATVGARNTSDHPTPYLEPYTINDGRGGTIEVLFKPEGETVLTRDGATVTGTPDSPVGISTELAERTAHQKLQEDIDTIKFTAQLRDGVAPQQPLTMDINDVQLERKIDMIDQPHRYAPDGKGVMMDTGDSTVGVRFVGAADMNADELRRITEASSFVAAPEQALFDVREDGTPLNETNGVGLVNYTKQDVQAFVNSAFPEHIANMIELHDQPSNPASQLGAWGFFAFDYQGNGPRIIIDVTPGKRDWNSVLSTISEEVAHFSFDSWTTGRSQAFMRKFYDRAWELYGGDAINDMPHYVESNDMDPTNPTDQHKWILLNEYFSKQGTSLADFSDSKVSAPGGLTRAEVDELSKLSADTLDNLTIDFEDIQNMDSREFATLILKAQTRAINPRPSMFTLRDTDSVVTVRPTPFGRITKYRVNTEEAEAHTNYRSWIQRSDGSGLGNAAKAWRFFWARNNTYQNSITGREIQRTVTANVRIDAAATSRSLQLAFQTSRRAQAVLREAGLPEAIRGEGYVATFQRGGITNERHLALAKLADEQMKMAQHAPFQGAEKIRNEALAHVELMRSLGEAREIPAADLGRMMATIEQEARIYRADYSHVRYKAHNAPEDKANLERMNAYLRGTDVEGKTVYDDYLAASAEKARLLSLPDQDTAEVRTAIYAQEQLMKPYTRLEALYTSFAYKLRRPKSKLKDRDADIVQLMKNELTDLTTEQEYGLGKAGIGTMDSVSRRRKLDPDAGSEYL